MKIKKRFMVQWFPPNNTYVLPMALCKTRESAKQWIDEHTAPETNTLAFRITEIDIEL